VLRLILLAGAVASVQVVLGCSSDSSGSNAPQKSSKEQADEQIDAVLSGKLTDQDKALGALVQNALTVDEFSHLADLDWSSATAESLLADPAVLKAMAVVEPSGAARLKAASVDSSSAPALQEMRSLQPAATYTCDADCDNCRSALDAAIEEARARLLKKTENGARTCAGFALLTAFAGVPQAGAVVCGAVIANILVREVLALGKLSLCKAGLGTELTLSDDPASGSVSILNASCGPPSGSYSASCQGCTFTRTQLTCTGCYDSNGGAHQTTIALPCLPGIANCQGQLVCGGC
jgi:hypothetical protein